MSDISPKIFFHEGDLPSGFTASLDAGSAVAIDSEATGLHLQRDRLCLVQVATADKQCHLVRIAKNNEGAGIISGNSRVDGMTKRPQELTTLLMAKHVTKIFHFARFDVARFWASYAVMTAPVFCTKIASHLARTYAPRHGLNDLCKEILGVNMNKQEQSSDWGRDTLTDTQMAYAAADVIYLHELAAALEAQLKRENRWMLAEACFGFLPIRSMLDAEGWNELDVFAHKMHPSS